MSINEAEFLGELFRRLNDSGIVYAVMRNYELLPVSLNGHDLDLIVERGSIDRARDVILASVRKCGGRLLGEIVSPRFRELAVLGNVNGCWWGAEIDLCDGGYVWEPIAGAVVLKHRMLTDAGVWALSPQCANLLGCAKEILMNRRLPVKYIDGAREALKQEWRSLFLDQHFAEYVEQCISCERSIPRLKWLWMRFVLMLSGMRRGALEYTRDVIGYYLSKIHRIARPCGHVVAILGTDGSGKSTLINSIGGVLNLAFHKSVIVHHLRPNLLPPLERLRGVNNTEGRVCSAPHASKPSGLLGSMVRLAYLVADYILGYYFKVRIRLAKLPVALWIFDRYAYDMIIDPRRFRIELPQWMIKMFICFVPRPELILCLGGDPAHIYARKPETSLEEVTRQVVSLKKLCDGNRSAVWIDTTSKVEESADEALMAILLRWSNQ